MLNLPWWDEVGAANAIFIGAVALFHRRSKNEPPLTSSQLPVTLKYDPWQTAPALVAIICFLGVLMFAASAVLQVNFGAELHQRVPRDAALVLTILVVGFIVGIGGLWLLLFKLFNPDSVVVAADGIKIVSGGRVRRWSWQQISDVELKFNARGGSQACLTIPAEPDSPIYVPRFLRTEAGPEKERDIYDLIRMALPRKPGNRRDLRATVV